MSDETAGVGAPASTESAGAERTVKLCVRLMDEVNFPLRDLVRFQGELTAYIIQAVESVDLLKVPLVVIRDVKAKDTTIRVPEAVHRRLAELGKERSASVNVLINTAVAHWLEGQQKKRVRKKRQWLTLKVETAD